MQYLACWHIVTKQSWTGNHGTKFMAPPPLPQKSNIFVSLFLVAQARQKYKCWPDYSIWSIWSWSVNLKSGHSTSIFLHTAMEYTDLFIVGLLYKFNYFHFLLIKGLVRFWAIQHAYMDLPSTNAVVFIFQRINYCYTKPLIDLIVFSLPVWKLDVLTFIQASLKLLNPSYIILRIHRLEGKQCRSRWGGS